MTHSVDTIRFLANSKSESNACLWYTIRQNIQNGFEMDAHFRFRRAISSLSFNSPLPEGFLIPPELKEHREIFFSSNLLSFVIQNLSEISTWKKKGSTNLRMIPEYLAISVGFLERDITKGSNLQAQKYYPYVLVSHCSPSNVGKQNGRGDYATASPNIRVLACKILSNTDFPLTSQSAFQLRVVYSSSKNLEVYLSPSNRGTMAPT